MELHEFRINILKQEIELITQKMNHFDTMRLRTKQMAIFLWVAVIGFGLKNEFTTNSGLLFLLSTLIPLPFWYIEASFCRYCKGWSLRFKAIRKFLSDGEYPIADGTKATLDNFLSPKKKSDFPLSDFWAENTVGDEMFKKTIYLGRSYFNHKIIWVYFPMTLSSLTCAVKILSGANWFAVGIPAGLLVVAALMLSIKLNKKIVIDSEKSPPRSFSAIKPNPS